METARLVLGSSAAVLTPFAFPALRASRAARAGVAALLTAAAVAPRLDGWRGWVVLAAAVAAAAAPRVGAGAGLWQALAAGVAVAAVATVVFDPSLYVRAGEELVAARSRVVLIAALFALTTFGWGLVIQHAVERLPRPLHAVERAATAPGMPAAGRIIGWIERGLIFAAVVLGRPEAIAVVVALKSIARFPHLRDDSFAEYFLIGSLLSLAGAVAGGVAARALLGLDLL